MESAQDPGAGLGSRHTRIYDCPRNRGYSPGQLARNRFCSVVQSLAM